VDGQSVVCPAVRTTSGWLDLFPLPCRKSSECRTVMGPTHVCCKGFCTKGVSAPAQIRYRHNHFNYHHHHHNHNHFNNSQFHQLDHHHHHHDHAQADDDHGGAETAAQASFVLFPVPCENSAQCRASSGADHVCCEARCVRGVPAPRSAPQQLPQASHQPLLGVIPRECPAQPLGELLFEVQSCKTDADCWPRVCCPDGNRSYCRTAKARLDLVPVVGNQIDAPVRMLEQYLQCTAPPQYDLFPRQCSSSVDCFPNLDLEQL
ncbi:hypothetical protein MSG28_006874, partial [Choristoneura fumiferana]